MKYRIDYEITGYITVEADSAEVVAGNFEKGLYDEDIHIDASQSLAWWTGITKDEED